MALSDAQLVRAAVAGDDAAFDELVSRYRTRVYHLALSRVRFREAALDLAQDAFVQAYMGLRTLREPGKFGAWLTSITSNLCLMHLRRAREITVPDEAFDELEQVYPADDTDAAMVRDALDRLPNGTRDAAILYFVEEMKLAEVAEFLEISLPAVKSRVRDARTRLRKEMIEMVKHTAKKDEPGDEFNKSLQHKMELARWYREMADLFTNGVPIMTVLDMLASENFSAPVKEATLKLKDALLARRTMSEAVAELPALQTSQAVGLIRAGEVGGIIDWTTQFLADWIEVENSQRQLELALWCRTLGSILVAGVPVEMAFDTSLGVLRTKALLDAARDLIRARQSGKALDEVLARHADVLLPVVQVSVLAGEKSDTLGNALQWAANAIHARLGRHLFGREFHLPAPDAQWVKDFALAVVEYTGSHSPGTRSTAISMLGQLGVAETADTVIAALTDTIPEVRQSAVCAAAEMGCRDACRRLVERLQDSEAPVRRASAEALAALGCIDAAPAMAELIADFDQRVAHTATKCLESLGAVDVLQRKAMEVIGSDRAIVRVRAVYILKNHPTPDAADELIRALDDEVSNVAYQAALALAKIGRMEAVPMLQKMRDTHNQIGYLQWAAAEALEKLGC